jgi:hypothetical protein
MLEYLFHKGLFITCFFALLDFVTRLDKRQGVHNLGLRSRAKGIFRMWLQKKSHFAHILMQIRRHNPRIPSLLKLAIEIGRHLARSFLERREFLCDEKLVQILD